MSDKVIIIGGGASGLLCAYLIAQSGIDTTIIEKNKMVGRKLLSTGNGRCNFTNSSMDIGKYESCDGDTTFVENVLREYNYQRIIDLFSKLGIPSRDREGYYYPYNNQAITFRDRLQEICEKKGVNIITDVTANRISCKNGKFLVYGDKEYECDKLILATGGKAGPDVGGSGLGYKLARSLGHKISKVYPSLTGLVSKENFIEDVAGVRMQGTAKLEIDGKILGEEYGEIQMVKDGISGIPIFQLSGRAGKAIDEGKSVNILIDFLPEKKEEQLAKWLENVDNPLTCLVNNKWQRVMNKLHREGHSYEELLKRFSVPVCGTFGFERSQVTHGGVLISEVDMSNMESKVAPGLYLLGELLDVDGKCGGYNLHFAFATAAICAQSISGGKVSDILSD